MDKEKLLAARHDTDSGQLEEPVELPDLGTVVVRGLSRAEARIVQDIEDESASERKMIALGMIAPQLTEDEVGVWQSVSDAMEMEPVVNAITRLSGLARDAGKQAYRDFQSDPDAEFRSLPGAEARHDGRADVSGDVQR